MDHNALLNELQRMKELMLKIQPMMQLAELFPCHPACKKVKQQLGELDQKLIQIQQQKHQAHIAERREKEQQAYYSLHPSGPSMQPIRSGGLLNLSNSQGNGTTRNTSETRPKRAGKLIQDPAYKPTELELTHGGRTSSYFSTLHEARTEQSKESCLGYLFEDTGSRRRNNSHDSLEDESIKYLLDADSVMGSMSMLQDHGHGKTEDRRLSVCPSDNQPNALWESLLN